ncbi:MAG: SOS response-associated peptidase [bacterium]|nr:SOS response-associated peptidase [bacterium]
MPERPLTNARSESVDELRSFSESFRSRRCVMPGIEYYEWTKTTKRRRTFVPRQEEFLFAGLWDAWTDAERSLDSCVMLTTSANEVVAPIHDRMPVILRPEDVLMWLDGSVSIELLRGLMRPFDSEQMSLVPEVSEPPKQTSLF